MSEKKAWVSKVKEFLFIRKENKVIGITIYGFVLIAIIAFAFFFFFYSTHKKGPVKISSGNISDTFVYFTDTVKYQSPSEVLLLNGKITYDQNKIIRVFSPVSGTVEDIHVTVGNYVSKSQVLASIRSADISEMINAYKIAEANLSLAKKKLSVAESLYAAKFTSQLDVLNARKEYTKARDEVRKTSEILKIYETSPQGAIPYYKIKAPIDGYIVEKNINNSMKIRQDNNTNLFVISDLSTVWVYANVYEEDIGKVKEGLDVKVHTEVFPGREFYGRIENLSPALDSGAKAMRVRVVIDNKEGLLKPEMFASASLQIPRQERMLAVQSKAIVFDKDEYFVVKVANGKFFIRQVQLLGKNSTYTFLSSGVSPGDIVVTEGSLLIYNEQVNLKLK